MNKLQQQKQHTFFNDTGVSRLRPAKFLVRDWLTVLGVLVFCRFCWTSREQAQNIYPFKLMQNILTQALHSIDREQYNIGITVTCISPTSSHTQTFLPQNLHTSQPTLHSVDVVIPDFIFELLTQWGRSWFFLLLLVSTGNNCWHWSAISSNIMASQC